MKIERYVFPPFTVDTREGNLRRDAQDIVLRAKTFAVLSHLLDRAGRLVSKDELLEQVWAGTYVAEGALTVCITEIRKALGDDPKQPRFIATVPKRGYRFIAKVVSREENTQQAQVELLSPAPSTQHPTPNFVGREAELAQLHSMFAKARDGQRQLVFVTGEPGIGKTTLVETFLFEVRSREEFGGEEEEERQNSKLSEPRSPTPVPWITRGQCIEHYGAGEAYLPILDALEHLCRAPGGDHLVELLDRYAPTWLVQMPAVLGTADVAALQRRVVGATHERMLREVTGALEALTTDSTVILVLEDLHWSDYSTLDLLSFLARRQSPARLLIIGTYRPADVLRREHPLYPVKQELHLHGQCEEISVRSLTTEDVGEYLARQFAGGTFATTLGAVVHHRTEGNPLFMVTVVKEFVTRGIIAHRDGQWDLVGEIGKIEVPSGLRQFIEQQLTRSTPEEHAVLEAASVVGMDFSVAAVAVALGTDSAGVEATCEALARRGQFLRAHGVSTWPDGTVAARYRFLHALYQEVLYERMSVGRRIGIHRQVGARVEAAYGNRTTEIATELAVHFEQGQDIPRAVQYLGHAGENAIRQNAHVEAIRLLTHAIALLHTQPDTPERAQQELGLSLLLRTPLAATKGYVAPELEHAYTRAHELCKQVGGPPQLFMVLGGPYALHLLRAELRAAYRVAEERMRLAESLQFDLFLQVAHFSLGVPLLFMGDFTQARLHLERSVALYKPQQLSALGHLYDPGVMSLSQLAFVLWLLGYPDQARQRIQETLTLARDLAHPFSLAYALGWAARTYRLRGEQQASHELEDEWLGLCTEYGFSHQFAMATISQGWGFAEEGQPEAGLMQIRQGLTAYRATGEELGSSSYVILLAEAYGRTGRFAEALTTFSEAQAFIHKTEERFWEAELYRLQGEVTLQQEARAHELEVGSLIPQVSSLKPLAPNGVTREAEAWFLKAIAVARQQQAKSFELRSTVSLARLWHKQGKAREAHQVLSAIHDWFTEGFDTKDLQEAKALLDTLSREGGREETQPNQKRFPTRQSEQDAPEEHSVVVTTMNQELSGERTAGTALSPPLRLAVVNRGKRPPQPSHLQGRKPRIRDKRRT